MRVSDRSFPHPVVGNADDVPEAEFQATFDFESDKTNFYLTATVRCSSKTLLRMIKKGTACYAVHVECSNTLFRQSYDFDAGEHKIVIPATRIRDAVEVNAFVRSKVDVPEYTVDGSHDDYGDETFAVGPGDVLAKSDGWKFDALHEVDPLRRIGALMDIGRSGKNGDHAMEVEFNIPDKIRIMLCATDFVAYGEVKAVPHLTSHLTTTLVLPVLVEAIHLLDDDEVQQFKWAGLLRQRLDALNLGSSANPLEKAQRLLDLPIRRALAEAKKFLDSSGS